MTLRPQRRSSPSSSVAARVALPGKPWILGAGALACCASLVLLWNSAGERHLPGCGPESGCDAVLSSRWSVWLGTPVSLPAAVTYLGLLTGVWLRSRTVSNRSRARLDQGLMALGFAVAGAAVWFVMLQLAVIRAICPFCMLAHACGLTAGLLLLRAGHRSCGFRLGGVGGGLILTLLIGGQLLVSPPRVGVRAIPETALRVAGASPELVGDVGSRAAPQLLQLHNGLFQLDLRSVPLLGSPDASHVVLHFFDYSCEHCRALHPLLSQVHHALEDQLAIVSFPIPLNPDCNPIMKRVLPKHVNACAYARLALAVWLADRAQLEGFEDWIFAWPSPPDPEAARQEAGRRVGAEALGAALQNPWIDEYLALGIRIYHTNYLKFSKSQLPLLMTKTNLVSGTVRSTNELYRILGLEP